MVKRRRKNNDKSQLKGDVLARARKNAGVDEEAKSEGAESAASDDTSSGDDGNTVSVGELAARRRKLGTVQLERSRQRGELTNEMIADVLHNPTIEVDNEELSKEYNHVLLDLRNMGILAAILIVIMMIVAFSLPTF